MDVVNYLLDEKSPKSKQPEAISIQLKPHQLASLYRMCMLDRDCGMTMKSAGIKVRSNIAILADLAGYGKTVTFLSLVELLKAKDIHWMPQAQTYITEGYGITLTKEREHENINTSLLVVPDNLVDHWKQHLDDYTELSYEIVETGTCNKILVEDYDLILCPARYYNKFNKENREYFWNRVAFDEADSIHIPNTEHINARFLWLITATYDNIPRRRNKGFLRNLFKPTSYWEDPIRTYFYPVVVKGSDEFVKKSFSLIEPEIRYVECLTPNYIKAIREYINPHILELVNAGDIDGAISALGGNVDTDRNIIELVTRGLKNNITIVRAKIDTLDQLEISEYEREGKRTKFENKLCSLKVRLKSLEQAISEAADSDCTICCDRLRHPTLTPCCNNMFCAECLLKWLKYNNICPYCRGRFDPTGLQTITTAVHSNRPRQTKPKQDKLCTLVKIIKNNPAGQYIIFSGHAVSFSEIGQTLNSFDICFGMLTTTLQTETTLDKFRKGILSVILLDAEHNGVGIEIPQTTDVILYHQMRKSLETQAIARAQRPGRNGQLRVWKLKYQHEYAKLM
uniref:DEAD/SNF2-like helicase n=1 Tax=Marseillevirus LCMAC201 TaxID=2506605 RepID=A0A481YXL0_9VIRU|nr:MAG: DEAD/SNF2-like helicase [Marseillevirus LCMAC201]